MSTPKRSRSSRPVIRLLLSSLDRLAIARKSPPPVPSPPRPRQQLLRRSAHFRRTGVAGGGRRSALGVSLPPRPPVSRFSAATQNLETGGRGGEGKGGGLLGPANARTRP